MGVRISACARGLAVVRIDLALPMFAGAARQAYGILKVLPTTFCSPVPLCFVPCVPVILVPDVRIAVQGCSAWSAFAVHASMRKRTLLRQKLNRQNGFPLFLIFFM